MAYNYQQFENEIKPKILELRNQGKTYVQIQNELNLPSNHLIKKALGKSTGLDPKYRGRYVNIHMSKSQYLDLLKKLERLYLGLSIITSSTDEIFNSIAPIVETLTGIKNFDKSLDFNHLLSTLKSEVSSRG